MLSEKEKGQGLRLKTWDFFWLGLGLGLGLGLVYIMTFDLTLVCVHVSSVILKNEPTQLADRIRSLNAPRASYWRARCGAWGEQRPYVCVKIMYTMQ